MSDVRSVGTAVESYAVDQNYYPRNFTSLVPVRTSVEPSLVPAYMGDVPDVDGWGMDLRYQSDASGSNYTVLSYGKENPCRGTSVQRSLPGRRTFVAPADPAKLRPEIPDALSRAILRCLEREPARRFQDASALRMALERCKEPPP